MKCYVRPGWFDRSMSIDLSTHWIQAGFVAFDTETTGVDVTASRVVTAAAVVFKAGEPTFTRSWLIKVDVDIPEVTTAVHGITNEMSQRDGQDQLAALTDMRDFLISTGLPIVCFNSGFDIPLFNADLERKGLALLPTDQVLCSYVIDKQCNKYVKGKAQRRLKPTAERYGLELSEADWHGAQADATAAGRIFMAEMATYPELTSFSIEQLADAINAWRDQQDREFQEWLSRQPTRPATGT
jgi:DNA polymerase-3 subunit epsilon